MPTKWLQERRDGSKNEDGIPLHRALCGLNDWVSGRRDIEGSVNSCRHDMAATHYPEPSKGLPKLSFPRDLRVAKNQNRSHNVCEASYPLQQSGVVVASTHDIIACLRLFGLANCTSPVSVSIQSDGFVPWAQRVNLLIFSQPYTSKGYDEPVPKSIIG